MLTALSIRDIVLIEKLDVDFTSGLTVLTGETGAGKSILLDALSLALGARGDGGLVRTGKPKGQVIATFDVSHDHPARQFLLDRELLEENETCIVVRRVQNADGRTRAFINDNPASAGILRDLGGMLVELHGQHDDRALVDVRSHCGLLDSFGGLEDYRNDVGAAYRNWRDLRGELQELRQRVEAAAREMDYLRTSVDELKLLSPQEGEEPELAEKRQTMMQAEKIADDIHGASEVLLGSASPVPLIANTLKLLERKAALAPGLLDDTIDQLGGALDRLADAQTAIEAAQRAVDFDPSELEATEERLFSLRAASRKFNKPVDNLAAFCSQMQRQLDELDAGEERLVTLAREVERSAAILDKKAMALSAKRRRAAKTLVNAVMKELPPLKLEQAEFIVQVDAEAGKTNANGIDSVEFLVRTNRGGRAGPIMKVASGGELSRFLLALKVVLADRGSAPTLVFDEIDTGVGGAVADAMGRRLSRLAQKVQVLSVTHAPQVAAMAENHLLIEKAESKNRNLEVSLVHVDDHRKLEEIARMLSGAQITNEARAAAQKLIAHGN